MFTWSDTSPRGSFHGGRGGRGTVTDLGPGRRVWRNGGGPGYAGDTVSSVARLSKSTSSGGDIQQSSLWGGREQGQTGTTGRGGYWARGRGVGAPPRGRGTSSEGSEHTTHAPAHVDSTSTNTGASAPSTRSEDFQMQDGNRDIRDGYSTSAGRGSRGTFASPGGYAGRGGSGVRGSEGRGRGGQFGRGRGGQPTRGRGRGGLRGGEYEEQQRSLWGSSAKPGSADPWAGFPYSRDTVAATVTDPWGGATAQDDAGGQSARGSFRGRGGDGRGRGRGDSTNGSEYSLRGARGGRGDWTPRGYRGGRGDFAGRGRVRGNFQGQGGRPNPPSPEVQLPPPRDIMSNLLVPAIAHLAVPEDVSLEEPFTIKDFKAISSYTWSHEKNPTIIVPGAPRRWLDRPLPFKVPFDRGVRIFHEDALHMGDESTLLPLFRAVDTLATNFVPEDAANESAIDWTTVDFVTDRNNLRKLMRWVRDADSTPSPTLTSSGADTPVPNSAETEMETKTESGATALSDSPVWDPRKDFRINMQLGGTSTVLMHRWAAQAREWVEPPKAGCRANFERESTAAIPGCEDGGGHYRIVQYTIGGLNLVVRFEVDAFEDPNAEKIPIESPVSPRAPSLWEETPGAAEWGPDTTSTDDTSPAQKSSKTDIVDLWGGPVSNASDWGFSEASPASPSSTRTRTDGSSIWGGPASNADDWGLSPEKKDKGAGEVENDDAGAWGPVDDPSVWQDDASLDDGTSWGAVKEDGVSAWAAQVDTAATRNSSTVTDFDMTSAFVSGAELKIVPLGSLLSQSSILELATRSTNYLDRISNNDTFLQMFLTQTPTHLVAVHQRGNFERVIRQELASEEFMRIGEREDIRRGIAQFVALLHTIQRLVKEHGKVGRVSLVCVKGELQIFGLVGQEGVVHQEDLARFDSPGSIVV